MLFTLYLATSALALDGLVHGSPLLHRQSSTSPPAQYHLQTQLHNASSTADCGSSKGGLWLYSYHTGAGLGDAVLSTNSSVAPEAYYDHSNPNVWRGQQFFMVGNKELGPSPMVVSSGAYQSYQAVTISSASDPDPAGYYFDANGLRWNSTEFAGWLACDWWHGSPQLFAELKRTYGALPRTCSKVKLIPVAY